MDAAPCHGGAGSRGGRVIAVRSRYDEAVGISLEMVIGVVVLTLLAVFLTGPGMWSEKWGWGWLRGEFRRRPPASTLPPAPPYPPAAAPKADDRPAKPPADAR